MKNQPPKLTQNPKINKQSTYSLPLTNGRMIFHSFMIYILLAVFCVLIPFILLNRYMVYLQNKKPIPGDDIYYNETELSFESVLEHIGRIEKYRGYDLSNLKEQVMSYSDNADRSGRDIHYYYSDYIAPTMKYLLLDNKNILKGAMNMADTWLRYIGIYLFTIILIPSLWIYFFYLSASQDSDIKVPIVIVLFLGLIVFLISTQILLLSLKMLAIYLSHKEKQFVKQKLPLGAINKAILSIESLISYIYSSKKIGADSLFNSGFGMK